MTRLLLLAVFSQLLFLSADAQFSQAYAPANWTVVKNPATAINSGSVNTSGAPGSIMLIGSDNGTTTTSDPVDIDFTITAIASGTWSFNWAYASADIDNDPQYDIAYVLRNGTPTALSATTGSVTQNGTYNVSVNAGDVIGFRMSAVDNGYGSATLTISSFIPPGGILPVTYTYFNGLARNNAVQLKWGTATEVNADRYEILRSANGSAFTQIGSVKAGGSTTIAQHYSFIDHTPSAAGYYRLRQVDADGSEWLSDIVLIRLNTGAAPESIHVYPNPAIQSTVTLGFSTPFSGKVGLYDISGKLLNTKNVTATRKLEWDVAALKAGTYFFRTDANAIPTFFIKK